jgi:hypothetical protein
VLACSTFLLGQALDVARVLELLGAVPTSRVTGDECVAVDDAYGLHVGENDEGAMGAIVRDRVVVEVEADVRCLADLGLDALVGWKRIIGQREQQALLVIE